MPAAAPPPGDVNAAQAEIARLRAENAGSARITPSSRNSPRRARGLEEHRAAREARRPPVGARSEPAI